MYKVIYNPMEFVSKLIVVIDVLIAFLEAINQSLNDDALTVIILLLECFKKYLEVVFK